MTKKTLAPDQAYMLVDKKAKLAGMSVGGYAVSKGVGRHVISKWKKKRKGTVTLAMAQKLGII